MKQHKSWKQIDRKTIHSTPHLKVHIDTVQLPGGEIIDDYSIIEKNDVVVAVTTDTEGNVLMLEEYRYAVDQTLFNLPAGTIVRGTEDLKKVALRELQEETGYTSDDISFVGTLFEYPTKDTHSITIFRVRNAVKTYEVYHEPTEQIALKLMRPEEVKKLVFENKIVTSSTLAELVLGFPELFGKN